MAHPTQKPPKALRAANATTIHTSVQPKKEEPKKAVEIPLPKVSAAPKEALDKLTAAGAQVMPLFADSSLLQVSFAHLNEQHPDMADHYEREHILFMARRVVAP